ncbi:hypothetical protein L249_1557 [Ophiocordyceps polyrhachis-furcata BCC 54312]|uniref:Methyltransferase domain-containing protein n=1 Tax=Ophiocordyceps polyrhachis-furcata BCC 54312 TaxID=1330021 RepID=A0A367L4F7_9HYPO|nr:hypothetical protein L249_1557 [Ophiocordyceps polyrhachis-furcata BCC 54312]
MPAVAAPQMLLPSSSSSCSSSSSVISASSPQQSSPSHVADSAGGTNASSDGPSLALADLLADRTDLIPRAPIPSPRRATALVAGCGRGYDALLLASFGYDVWAVDDDGDRIEKERARLLARGRRLCPPVREDVGCGSVTWLVADFLADDWSRGLGSDDGPGRFDLIYDYTLLCALSPPDRPRWAKRLAQLIVPDGRLVCLEFPSSKPMSEPGPPWGVKPELYEVLLSAPGEAPVYRSDGTVAVDPMAQPRHDALHRLAIIKPSRTHGAGTAPDGSVTDFISVWTR